jgi:hypothetical protein
MRLARLALRRGGVAERIARRRPPSGSVGQRSTARDRDQPAGAARASSAAFHGSKAPAIGRSRAVCAMPRRFRSRNGRFLSRGQWLLDPAVGGAGGAVADLH